MARDNVQIEPMVCSGVPRTYTMGFFHLLEIIADGIVASGFIESSQFGE
jgi:hypothetical protein